jgi:heterodisulfide reductase subunit A-like polyferredoxin
MPIRSDGEDSEKVVGAVMVVGGGISGMQASLDLADSGYKVYLVEKESAIGGHMAQLDKTFPTNDCAMCTISPRLVAAGRHLNIEILTQSEVVALCGTAGDFTASVHSRPRYVDPDSCTACGDCATVCPEALPSLFDEGLIQQRAAYKRYPQAIPQAFAIEKRGTAPCRDACPIGQRAQGYISLIREGRIEEAFRTIVEENPFPAICGRICDHRCESACTRGGLDEPLNIRALKRFVTDAMYARPRIAPEPVPRRHEERIAVIGAGPCGMTAARDLCTEGYAVSVFDALPVAGGMLRVGVPEFRLPAEIIDREVQDIVDLGVELRLSTPVKSLDELFEAGFSAVLIATGAHEGIRLPIPGSDLEGVLINTRFLRDVRLAQCAAAKTAGADPGDADARPPDPNPQLAIEGKRVLVLGGGDVAMDVARTALRLGATEARVACLESRGGMRAQQEEIAAALEEGVVLHNDLVSVQVMDDGAGRVAGLVCQRVAHFDFDERGGLSVQAEPDSEHVLAADVLIFSVGQRAGLAFIPEDAGVALTPTGTVVVDPASFATARPGVFAAGDSVSGTSFVIDAIATGQRAAKAIHRSLRGEPMLEPEPAGERPVATLARSELDDRVRRGAGAPSPRVPVSEIAVPQRLLEFNEFESGYTAEQARAEANRCLSCGTCSECLMCVSACSVGAIDHEMRETTRELDVGAVILAPGYQIYRAELSEEFGFGRFPNVVTSLQFERLLSASGPTGGHVKRPSDGRAPKKIAFLQCVGSRDQSHDYCSSVCCMYAAKEAIMAIEHDPDTEVHVFMMDTRAFSKGYESYYRRARDQYGIRYRRCRISSVKQNPRTGDLSLKYVESWAAEEGAEQTGDTRVGMFPTPTVCEQEFDMVVLAVGMEISQSVRDLGHRIGVELDDYGFCSTVQFDPLQTSRPGIFACGPFREPKDIPDSLVEASGAAAAAGELLAPARGSLARSAEYPTERDVSDEEPRVAVFVCHCGTNIGGVVDVPGVAEYAKALPGVVHAEDTLYACSQDGIAKITERVKELDANRVVVASCTPLTHEPLFQDSIRAAGLNPYLFEMANIRNQCSWVHGDERDAATTKAKDLVRMSTARCGKLCPLPTTPLPVTKSALVVGGGAAGMTAALSLAEQGFPVHLVEKSDALGGNLRALHFGLDGLGTGSPLQRDGQSRLLEPREFLEELIDKLTAHPLIRVDLETELVSTSGVVGNFVSKLRPNGRDRDPADARADSTSTDDCIEVHHGVTILATGGVEYRGEEYGYGSASNIVTQQELEARLARQTPLRNGDRVEPLPRSVVMIQCVGPAERYCARICCTSALKNALILKRLDPTVEITVVYRDIRTYGFKERLYAKAREQGVIFIHYDEAHGPDVRVAHASGSDTAAARAGQRDAALEVRVWDQLLAREVVLEPDLLVLSTPVVPAPAAEELRSRLKVPLDADGFFMEAHTKMRPVDFLSEGIFMAGMAHYPKLLDEATAHARAAAARAATVLSQDTISAGGMVAAVKEALCVGCLTCVRSCPFGAVHIHADLSGVAGVMGAAHVEAAICQGCGLCVAECPAGAIDLMHHTDEQLMSKVDALFDSEIDREAASQ